MIEHLGRHFWLQFRLLMSSLTCQLFIPKTSSSFQVQSLSLSLKEWQTFVHLRVLNSLQVQLLTAVFTQTLFSLQLRKLLCLYILCSYCAQYMYTVIVRLLLYTCTPMSAPFISMASFLEVRRNNKLELWQPFALAHLRGPCISLRVSSPMMRAVRGFLTS